MRTRHAFTLIELLVVISIIGVLIGAIAVAVTKAMAMARVTQCKQHLSQLGRAFLTHEATHGFFPSGGRDWYTPPSYTGNQPHVGAEQQAGWGFQILPFIEAEPIWRGGPAVAIATPQPVFFCPTRRGPQTVKYDDEYTPSVTGGMLTHALGDYGGSNWEGTGAIRRYTPVSRGEITDGVINTLLLSEKRLNLADLGRPQPDDNEGYTAGWDEDTIRSTLLPPQPDFLGSGYDTERRFGSSHANGVNILLCDGSVRTLSYAVDQTTFERLGNKSDGNPINLSDY